LIEGHTNIPSAVTIVAASVIDPRNHNILIRFDLALFTIRNCEMGCIRHPSIAINAIKVTSRPNFGAAKNRPSARKAAKNHRAISPAEIPSRSKTAFSCSRNACSAASCFLWSSPDKTHPLLTQWGCYPRMNTSVVAASKRNGLRDEKPKELRRFT